ncbi:MAG: hypothetical protein ACLUD0_10655 [Eubacterium ramulus]
MQTNGGRGGLESQCIILTCLRSHSLFLTQIITDLKNEKNIGDTLVTTLDYDVPRRRAYEALGDRKDGAAWLSAEAKRQARSWPLVSKPDYDPNTLADTCGRYCVQIATAAVCLLNRATSRSVYPPGSTL